MVCPTCEEDIPVYVRRKYGRYNEWDRVSMCMYCGAKMYWGEQEIEAKKEPTLEWSTKDELIGLAILLASILVIYLIFG
jgi:hypothetical protein